MSTAVLSILQETIARTRWADGINALPTDTSTPTIAQWLDWITFREWEVMEKLPPKLRLKTNTITCVAGTVAYTDIADLWDEQFFAARLRLTSDDHTPLEWCDYAKLLRDYRLFNTTLQQGRPRLFTRNPLTGSIMLYPTPDAAYTVEFTYQYTPAMLALAANTTWFFATVDFAASTTRSSDDTATFDKGFVDRPRNVTITTATTRTGTNPFTITGLDTSGATVTETLTFTSGSGSSTKTGTQVFATIESIEAGASNPDTLSVSFGIGSTFASGSTVATISHVPDQWALRVVPLGGAADYFNSSFGRDEEQGQFFENEFQRRLAELAKRYAQNPMTDVFFFGRGSRRVSAYIR